MNLMEYKKHLTEMNDVELMELIQDIRRNREQSMNVTRIKAVRKKSEGKNLQSALKGISEEDLKALREKFLGKES